MRANLRAAEELEPRERRAGPSRCVVPVVLALKRVLRADGPRVTSLVQGSIRINTYIGLVFVAALYGDEGVALFALASALMVPLVNVVSILVLTIHGANEATLRPTGIAHELIGNPLIQARAAGLALSVLGLRLPGFLASTLGMLAEPALVSGTLAVGAAITVRIRRRDCSTSRSRRGSSSWRSRSQPVRLPTPSVPRVPCWPASCSSAPSPPRRRRTCWPRAWAATRG